MTERLKVLIVGGGGREHALAWALQRGGHQVTVSPGNLGIAEEFDCQPAPDGVLALAQSLAADLVVVGPEAPLVAGLVDELQAAGINALGPRASGARIEASKVFMKQICESAKVKTAAFAVFEKADAAAAWLKDRSGRWVVKADGLCAGKGVTVCASAQEATRECERMLEGAFGSASSRILVEAFLPGLELSVLGLCDGDDALLFAPARDHKALYDGDRGPNTGGMGAVAPLGEAQGVSPVLMARIHAEVFKPTLAALKAAGEPYLGILYAGLMIDGNDVAVLEFNCRFGDPEAQAVLFGTEVEITPLLAQVARGDGLGGDLPDLVAACRPTCAIVLASEGYPEKPIHGRAISTPETSVPKTLLDKRQAAGQSASQNVSQKVFYAGVAADDSADAGDVGTAVDGKVRRALQTNGGRVLAATASADDFPAAIRAAYALTEQIHFSGQQHRTDIGKSVNAP